MALDEQHQPDFVIYSPNAVLAAAVVTKRTLQQRLTDALCPATGPQVLQTAGLCFLRIGAAGGQPHPQRVLLE
ncbi:hypothetical protein [Hymenobacter armeniacus]|uniref:hypothetical protein n=1 Tax=Hymenobacter armeniacus TaxID=2771358 RepID=UPI001689B7FB|nr:hypothetical protein [Hymenobacter armeniacus]